MEPRLPLGTEECSRRANTGIAVIGTTLADLGLVVTSASAARCARHDSLDTHFWGPYYLTRACLPYLSRHNFLQFVTTGLQWPR